MHLLNFSLRLMVWQCQSQQEHALRARAVGNTPRALTYLLDEDGQTRFSVRQQPNKLRPVKQSLGC